MHINFGRNEGRVVGRSRRGGGEVRSRQQQTRMIDMHEIQMPYRTTALLTCMRGMKGVEDSRLSTLQGRRLLHSPPLGDGPLHAGLRVSKKPQDPIAGLESDTVD